MDTKITIVAILLSIALILSIFQTVQLNGIKGKLSATGAVTAKTSAGAIDMSGWTENEKMNYEMHGTIPARLGGSSPSGSPGAGMVGGC